MKNSMVFLKYSQDLCLEFKTNHTHCFCWECIPYLSLFVLMFCRGYEFPQTERVPSRERREKQKLDYVNIVWKWCDQIPTWRNQAEITVVGKTSAPYDKWVGELPQGRTDSVVSKKGTHKHHIRSGPCLPQGHQVLLFMSSDSVNLVQLSSMCPGQHFASWNWDYFSPHSCAIAG